MCAAVTSGCAVGTPSPRPTVTVTSSSSATTASPSPIEPASVVDSQVVEHADRRYRVVTLPLDDWDVRVGWDSEDPGTMLDDLIADDPTIAVATNAGIFTPELAPGGLLVSHGEQLRALNLADGAGNFHLTPNGVFAVLDNGTAAVVDSTAYDPAGVEHATQSGPALVLDGEVHPAFRQGSTNLAIRNGVGVSADGTTVYVAISLGLTNLWDFATLFRDQLDVPNALYLDGQVSYLWVDGMSPPGPLAGPFAGVITAHPW